MLLYEKADNCSSMFLALFLLKAVHGNTYDVIDIDIAIAKWIEVQNPV